MSVMNVELGRTVPDIIQYFNFKCKFGMVILIVEDIGYGKLQISLPELSYELGTTPPGIKPIVALGTFQMFRDQFVNKNQPFVYHVEMDSIPGMVSTLGALDGFFNYRPRARHIGNSLVGGKTRSPKKSPRKSPKKRSNSKSNSKSEKLKIFKLLLKKPRFAGKYRWTDPRNPGPGKRWTRTDLDLYKSMGGKFKSTSKLRGGE